MKIFENLKGSLTAHTWEELTKDDNKLLKTIISLFVQSINSVSGVKMKENTDKSLENWIQNNQDKWTEWTPDVRNIFSLAFALGYASVILDFNVDCYEFLTGLPAPVPAINSEEQS
jgi:hypothetical protein